MALTFATLKDRIGDEIGVSGWMTVSQEMIDGFAACTRDFQWIHLDAERAARESPFGATVAHGYLTLSLIAPLAYEIGARPEGTAVSINYGLDRVRFLTPVRSGSRIRLRQNLMEVAEREAGRYLVKSNCILEIEGEERPALIAETLVLLVAEEGAR